MKIKVMLVDDVDISLYLLKKQIQKVSPDIEVIDFSESVAAYNSINNINPDLILLDINMPVMDGWEFLYKMKQENNHHKVIIVSSSTSLIDREHSKNYSNVIQFLEKPVSKERIAECINSLAANNDL